MTSGVKNVYLLLGADNRNARRSLQGLQVILGGTCTNHVVGGMMSSVKATSSSILLCVCIYVPTVRTGNADGTGIVHAHPLYTRLHTLI